MCIWERYANICRNLHRLLLNEQFTVQVVVVETVVSIKHPRKRTMLEAPWPIIKLGSWGKTIVEKQGGQLLLGGHHISQPHLWRKDLKEFWDMYEGVDSNHLIYSLPAADRSSTIPYFVHGDEGRGTLQATCAHHQLPGSTISFWEAASE